MGETARSSPGDLEVRLLGGLQLTVGSEPVEGLRSGRARSLLAFLALHPGVAHSRQSLAFSFWPDSPEGQARTNLRNVLHTLRRAHPAVDGAMTVDDATLLWHARGAVDVEEFLALAGEAADADPDDPTQVIDRCRAAVEAYRGPLLPGEHDDWLVARRDDLHDRYRRTLLALATALIDSGRAVEATSVTRELVRAEPDDEAAHRLRIEAHHRAQDRAGAVRAYHECAATLERDLGLAPSPATEAAYREALADDSQPAWAPTGTGLVGRDADWHRVTEAWARAGPEPAVLLVTGEPGVGKTRLVEELARRCASDGAVVATARSYSHEGELGYGVLSSWLRSPDLAQTLGTLGPSRRAHLARVLPELDGGAPSVGLSEDERRQRLYDAAVAALTGSGRPTLLVVDDAHWADRASLGLIHFLARQDASVPLLIALTARDEELTRSHPLVGLRDGLAVLDRLVEAPLARLDRDATAELGGRLTGSPLDESAAAALYEESEGNPLFVVETVRGGWDGTPGAPLSPRLHAVIDGRLGQLSAGALTALDAVAVMGRPTDAGLIGELSELSDPDLAQALDELWRRRIFVELDLDAYDFSHGKIREAALDRIGPARRRGLHSRAADALMRRSTAAAGEAAASQIAHHMEGGHRIEEAVEWHQRAAIEAHDMSAYPEAVQSLERALALVPRLPADVRHTRELELLSLMPLALAGVQGYGNQAMLATHERATGVASELGVAIDPPLARSMVMAALCRDEIDEAAVAAQRLHDQALTAGRRDIELESHYLLGISAFWGARLAEARQHFETVASGFDPAARKAHHRLFGHDPQVVCMSRLANTLWFLGEADRARETCQSALALADEVGHPLSYDTAAVFASLLAVDSADVEALRAAVERLGRLHVSSVPHATKRDALLGLLRVIDGDTEAGLAQTRAALARCDGRNFYPGFQATIARVLVEAHRVCADHRGGLLATAEALAMPGTALWKAEIHRIRAEHLAVAGAPLPEVGLELDRAEQLATAQGAVELLRRVGETRLRLIGAAQEPA